ncbi:large ribosomal subunit protein bL17m-like isoform X2 [Gordionus sp. m RMFG-2023]|uniref:large ribosomal subunit protein bL17m-like isoform X2 n=1 Tax=Gordionus sp. m RMFG-2023 TaxID=3053472 RepID=UPI0031FCC177
MMMFALSVGTLYLPFSMRLYNSLYRRHPFPWYWREYDILKLSKLNQPLPPKLLYEVSPRHAKLTMATLEHMGGTKLRLEQLKHLVANLFRFERIETTFIKGEECRGYAERLIRDAIDLGDKHKPTMEMASWWLKGNEDLVHKLFKVLAPRYTNIRTCVTQIFKRSSQTQRLCVLELRNNPLPPIKPFQHTFKYTLSNVLLEELRKDFEEANIPTNIIDKTMIEKAPTPESNDKSDLRDSHYAK